MKLDLTLEQELLIIEFYKTHTGNATKKEFNLTSSKLNTLLVKYNIPKHTRSESQKLLETNNYSKYCEDKFNAIVSNINKDEFIMYYETHTPNQTAIKYDITISYVNKILSYFKYTKHRTPGEGKRLSFIEKYGDYDTGLTIENKHKEDTVKARYGVHSVLQLDEVKDKSRQTKLNRYGESNYNNREKAKQTCNEKYGVDNVFQAENIKDKIKETNLEKYGVIHPMYNEEIKLKVRATIETRFGGLGFASKIILSKAQNTMLDIYGVSNIMQNSEIKHNMIEHYRQSMLNTYGVPYGCLLPQCANANFKNDSKPNQEFSNLLDTHNIKYVRELSINNFRYDFNVNNNLIEINPTITHNSYMSLFSDIGIDKNYHMNKTQTAIDNGYRCIHIWDWDDSKKVVNQLLIDKDKLYARKCVVKEVSKIEAKDFINEYHLQGYAKDAIRLGLYFNDELVSIMTFGKPRYNKNYEYELIRYCSKCCIVGGAERLFKNFIKLYRPSSIISYCDLSKFDGHTYTKLGFILNNKPKPSKHWYSLKTKQHITDNLLRQRGFDQLFNTNFGKGTSNEQLMLEHGFLPVYDSGQATYVWKNNN